MEVALAQSQVAAVVGEAPPLSIAQRRPLLKACRHRPDCVGRKAPVGLVGGRRGRSEYGCLGNPYSAASGGALLGSVSLRTADRI